MKEQSAWRELGKSGRLPQFILLCLGVWLHAADTLVTATGGLADYVLAETSIVDVHDPMLTLKGLPLYLYRNAG